MAKNRLYLLAVIIIGLVCAQDAALAVNAAPTVVSVSPSTGTVAPGVWKGLVCTYSDANGASDLTTCNLMINTSIANLGAAHFVYNRVTNKLYIRNNAGANTPTEGVVRGTATTIASENAILDCAGTTVTSSGNTLTIAWRFQVKTTMAGKNCNLYMIATDSVASTSGWQDRGNLSVNPVNAAPTVVSVSPSTGTVAPGVWKGLISTYADANGASNLTTCNLMINTSIANAGAAHFVYNRSTNKFYIKNNAGAMMPTEGVVRGTATTIASENAILDCAGTTVTPSGNNLTIAWRFQVKPTMAGKNCNLYMIATDASAATSGWVDKGDLSVNIINVAPTVVSVSPSSGTVAPGVWKGLISTYADGNGASNLATCNLMINTSVANTGAAHFIYNRSTNKFYMKNNAGVMMPTEGVVRGTATTIASENAILDCAGTTVTPSGNNLAIAWRFQVKPAMAGKNCNLYMIATDNSASTSGWADKGDLAIGAVTAASLIELGKSCINSVAMMEPFDAAAAETLMQQAKGYFEQAKALEPNNPQANFGLAVTDAAVTAQNLIDKYEPEFAEEGSAAFASLKYTVGALQVMNLPGMMKRGQEPMSGLVTSYTDSVVHLDNGPTLELLLDMQNDVKNVVRPMLSRVAGYLGIVETYGGASFTFPIGTAAWEDYTILDIGDVYLFHGGLLAARWALAIPASYSVNMGTFNFDADPLALDINHNGLLPTSEWLPPSPFMTLTGSATMTGAKADMIAAADKITAGINATLAETSDNHDLIRWHTPDEGPTQQDLLDFRGWVAQAKASMNAVTTVNWEDEDGPQSMRVFLGAWNTSPPADLKTLCPTHELVRWRNDWAGRYDYDMRPAENGFPDTTLGGIFPDGFPELNESRKVFIETDFSGTLVGLTTYPANGQTNVSTDSWNGWIRFSGYPPATSSFLMQRYYAGAWRGVAVYPAGQDGNTYYGYTEGSLWPNSSYRMIITDEVAHQSITVTFQTGADQPF